MITLAILVAFGGTIWIGPSPLHAAATPEEVAQQELPRWLAIARNDDVKHYGFKNEQELQAATLGSPYQVSLLSPEAVQAYQPNQRVAAIIDNQAWKVFPVLVNGEARGLLTVAQLDGRWQAVEFSSLEQSRQLVRLQARLAKKNATVKLVKFAESTFALVEQDGGESLIYISGSNFAGEFDKLDKENLTAYTAQDFMPEVKKAFDQRVAAEQERQKHEKENGQAKP
jgi:hypothetical protein